MIDLTNPKRDLTFVRMELAVSYKCQRSGPSKYTRICVIVTVSVVKFISAAKRVKEPVIKSDIFMCSSELEKQSGMFCIQVSCLFFCL